MLFFLNGPFQFFQVFATLFHLPNFDQIVNLFWLKEVFINTFPAHAQETWLICPLNDFIYLLALKKCIFIPGIRLRLFQKLLIVLANRSVFFIAKSMIYQNLVHSRTQLFDNICVGHELL